MTQQLDQSDLVPGRGDKRTGEAYRKMMQAFQAGNTAKVQVEMAKIDRAQLAEGDVAGYDSIVQQMEALLGQAERIARAPEQLEEHRATKPNRRQPGQKLNVRPLLSRNMMIGGGIGLVVLCIALLMLVNALRGGSSNAAPQQPTPAPTAAAAAPAGDGANINSTSPISGTGSVLVTGDMRLKIAVGTEQAEISVAALNVGQYSMAGQEIGTVTDENGGRRLSFNGSVAVTVSLFKVDPNAGLAPVTFGMGDRKFEVLAQTDGNYKLVTYKDGVASEPLVVNPNTDKEGGIGLTNYPIIAAKDAGDRIDFTFPAKAAETATSTPVQ